MLLFGKISRQYAPGGSRFCVPNLAAQSAQSALLEMRFSITTTPFYVYVLCGLFANVVSDGTRSIN